MATNNYVDKAEFYALMVERKKEVLEAEKAGKPKPVVNDKIGKIILDIATNLSYRYNFINYTYRDEMVADGIETCIRYLDNFDPDLSKNPFGYYTKICYFSFVRRIHKETKQHDIKKKWIEKLVVDIETYASQDQDSDQVYTNTSADFAQEHMI